MAILNKTKNPWGEETAFEQLVTSNTTAQVKKAAADTAKAVMGDIKEQITVSNAAAQPKEDKALSNKEQVKQENRELLAQTRANLQKINQEIKKAKEVREKKYQEKLKQEKREQEKKLADIQQKRRQEDSLLAAIKRSQGSGERAKAPG